MLSAHTVIPLTEAPDAEKVGALGIIMMAAIGIAAVILDIPNAIQAYTKWKKMIKGRKKATSVQSIMVQPQSSTSSSRTTEM